MHGKIKICLLIIFIIFTTVSKAQDIIVRTNGARIEAKVKSVNKDSVVFTSYHNSESGTFYLAKSEIKFIEYNNYKIDYFEGSYQNSSGNNSTEIITGFEVTSRFVEIKGLGFSVENLFTENHLIIDFRNYSDSTFIADKGKMEFIFESKKFNFSVRLYPTSEKNMFSKFIFGETGKNKRYSNLSEKILTNIIIYVNDSIIDVGLTIDQSIELKELFSNRHIKREAN